MDSLRLLVFAHVAAVLVWIGAILSVCVVLSGDGPALRDRAALARQVYRKLAAPAFGVAFLTGLLRLGLGAEAYFVVTRWMHAKLPVALAVIAVHHVIGARVKRAESGDEAAARAVTTLGWALLVGALLASFLAVMKPF